MAILDHTKDAPTSKDDRSKLRIDGSDGTVDPSVPSAFAGEPYAGGTKFRWGKNPDLKSDLTAQTVIQSRGTFTTLADANANAPGEGPNDVALIGNPKLLHYWDVDNTTWKLDDTKAPIQTEATFATYIEPANMWAANRFVPVEQADGSVRLYLPTKTAADYTVWTALNHADQYVQAGGADATPIVTLSVFPDAATASNDEIIGAKAVATKDEAQDAALAAHIANLVTSIRDAGTAEDTVYPSEKSVRDLVDGLNLAGEVVQPFAATFAALGALPADTSSDVRYWTVLTKDDVGTGTALAPQYPAGIYLSGVNQAAGWNFAVALGQDLIELTDAQIQDPTDTTTGVLAGGKQLHDWYLNIAQFKSIPADGSVQVGESYNTELGDPEINTPTIRLDGTPLQTGDGLNLRNLTRITDNHALFINGPLELPNTGLQIPRLGIESNSDVRITFNGTHWKAPIGVPLVLSISDLNSGMVLPRGHTYVIQGSVPGMEFFLPQVAGSKINVKLTTNSIHPVTIKQSAAVGTQHIRTEAGNIVGEFVLPVETAGQNTLLEGDPTFSGVGRWNKQSDWELDQLNNNATLWTADTDYEADAIVQAVKPGTSITYLYSRTATGKSGTGVFDATEEDDWTEIGKAPVTLPVLETIEFTTQGYVSSWTSAAVVTLVDGTGTDYNMNDWIVVEDTASSVTLGKPVLGTNFGPPTNSTRTVKIQYEGNAQRRGLSAIRITFRAPAATTGLTRVVSNYFDGRFVAPHITNSGAIAGEQTFQIDSPDGWDFLTHAKVTQISEVNYADLELGVANEKDAYFAIAPTGANSEIAGQKYLIELAGAGTPPDPMTDVWWNDPTNMMVIGQYERSTTDSVVYPGAADNMQLGPLNIRYQDDPDLTALQQPTGVLGKDYAVGVVAANRGDITGEPKVKITHYTSVDRGNGVELLETDSPKSDLPIRRYTADGAISDEDQRAIFETGANNMTLPVSVQDRLIQIISEGPATIITADGTEQFTGSAGTSTDSILNVNETFKWATILGRGAAAGWSQYVGLVATAQSVGAMVDFSESPGPGDAGSFSLALTNSGANLRYILTLTCSNGTNFSPPLDVDDGTNRWWYDFDHTTGVVNIRRFGAFAGGSVRGVALYS